MKAQAVIAVDRIRPKPPVTVRIIPWTEWEGAARQWAAVAQLSPYSSFFTSAEWTGEWIGTWGPVLHPSILLFNAGPDTIACALLVSRRSSYAGIRVRQVFLNTAGEDPEDEACIEYNTFLCLEGWETEAAAALQQFLTGFEWHELRFDGCAQDAAMGALKKAFAPLLAKSDVKLSRYVDLAELRSAGEEYTAALSANTRQQIRRSVKLYQQGGPIHASIMTTLDDAVQCFDELVSLHEAAWRARGRSGVFASTLFESFHRRLIAKAFSSGAIHLIRVAAGDETIGVLYNFLWRGKIYFYQSGFRYTEDNRWKPGLVCHSAAVQTYLASDVTEYDFLAGDSQYKRSLATHSRPLEWLVLVRPAWRMRMIEALRGARRAYLDKNVCSAEGE